MTCNFYIFQALFSQIHAFFKLETEKPAMRAPFSIQWRVNDLRRSGAKQEVLLIGWLSCQKDVIPECSPKGVARFVSTDSVGFVANFNRGSKFIDSRFRGNDRNLKPIFLRWAFLFPNTMSEKTYLSVEEVAKKFGINPTTVYRLAQRGALPAFKIGSQWRFSPDMLDIWISDQINYDRMQKESNNE